MVNTWITPEQKYMVLRGGKTSDANERGPKQSKVQ